MPAKFKKETQDRLGYYDNFKRSQNGVGRLQHWQTDSGSIRDTVTPRK